MKTKLLALLLVLVMAVGMLAACGGGNGCSKHVDVNPKDGICDNEGCGATVEIPKCPIGACVDVNPKDGKCDVCKRTIVVTTTCENHKDNDGDGVCEACKKKASIWEDYEITNEWNTTELVFKLTDNSNNSELSSQCRRYMAGDAALDGSQYKENIDRLVVKRNDAAYEATKVNVTYKYYSTDRAWGWGHSIEDIKLHCGVKTSESPDMYCNFVYDMVAASLNGSFANLYSTVLGKDALNGVNYFQFLQKDGEKEYVDDGDDYMFEYMKSLTLSKHKMYCLSSDYFTDMVRAFFVVPVNVNLLNDIAVDETGNPDAFNADRTGNGDFDIEDFYELVWDGQWNYETLAQFSQKVLVDAGGKTDLNDVVGFAVSNKTGLSASGLMYTTPVTIINRVWDQSLDDGRGDYTYFYPDPEDTKNGGAEQVQELVDLCNNISTLFSKPGIISVSEVDAAELGMSDSLVAIREKFADGQVLFGGVVCLGSLEDQVYQNMQEDGGFGVVPVPLYRTVNPKTDKHDEYLTQIHNIGRVGAIAQNTLCFAQCTAFLDYMSTHSTDILNEYYNYKLKYDVAGGINGNAEMLEYIRYHVRSSFDKAFEDAIGKFFEDDKENGDANDYKWHEMLRDKKFIFTTMATEYKKYYGMKEGYLDGIFNTYPGLPE